MYPGLLEDLSSPSRAGAAVRHGPAQGDDRGPGRCGPARARGGRVLLHARSCRHASQPDRRTAVDVGVPDPFFVAAGVCLLGVVLLVTGKRSDVASTG